MANACSEHQPCFWSATPLSVGPPGMDDPAAACAELCSQAGAERWCWAPSSQVWMEQSTLIDCIEIPSPVLTAINLRQPWEADAFPMPFQIFALPSWASHGNECCRLITVESVSFCRLWIFLFSASLSAPHWCAAARRPRLTILSPAHLWCDCTDHSPTGLSPLRNWCWPMSEELFGSSALCNKTGLMATACVTDTCRLTVLAKCKPCLLNIFLAPMWIKLTKSFLLW